MIKSAKLGRFLFEDRTQTLEQVTNRLKKEYGLGIPKSYLSQIKNDRILPSLRIVAPLCNIMGKDYKQAFSTWLYGRIEKVYKEEAGEVLERLGVKDVAGQAIFKEEFDVRSVFAKNELRFLRVFQYLPPAIQEKFLEQELEKILTIPINLEDKEIQKIEESITSPAKFVLRTLRTHSPDAEGGSYFESIIKFLKKPGTREIRYLVQHSTENQRIAQSIIDRVHKDPTLRLRRDWKLQFRFFLDKPGRPVSPPLKEYLINDVKNQSHFPTPLGIYYTGRKYFDGTYICYGYFYNFLDGYNYSMKPEDVEKYDKEFDMLWNIRSPRVKGLTGVK